MIQQAIQEILQSIPKDHLFDSHFVINELIRKHSDEYLRFANSFNHTGLTTEIFHGHIAQEIANFEGTLASRKQKPMSWSHNIHGECSECSCWQKI